MLPDDAVRKAFRNPENIPTFIKNKINGIDYIPMVSETRQIGYYGVPFYLSKKYHRHLDPVSEPVSIWERDWDMLIVLDACRVDIMEEVYSDYQFIDTVNSIWSVGGHSEEWLKKTFNSAPTDIIENTAYVSANHYANTIADLPFAIFENLNDVDIGDDFPAPPAHVVTDYTVDIARNEDFERLIVHYMQPHKPFLYRDHGRYDIQLEEWTISWRLYREYLYGNKSKNDVLNGFMNNLKYVLDEIQLLLENIDAPQTVLTSDHGNAIGNNFLWDHHVGVQLPSIRRVPWIETTATDKQTLSPRQYETVSRDEEEVKDRLEKLGYL